MVGSRPASFGFRVLGERLLLTCYMVNPRHNACRLNSLICKLRLSQ